MEQAAAVLLLGGNAWRDIRKQRISAGLTAGVFLAAAFLRIFRGEFRELLAGLIPGALLLGAAWLTKEAMGYGDGLVELALGAVLGWRAAVQVLMGAFLLAAVFCAAALALRRVGRKSELPFLPFFLAAYLLLLLSG